jgi:hypothetical protein
MPAPINVVGTVGLPGVSGLVFKPVYAASPPTTAAVMQHINYIVNNVYHVQINAIKDTATLLLPRIQTKIEKINEDKIFPLTKGNCLLHDGVRSTLIK